MDFFCFWALRFGVVIRNAFELAGKLCTIILTVVLAPFVTLVHGLDGIWRAEPVVLFGNWERIDGLEGRIGSEGIGMYG